MNNIELSTIYLPILDEVYKEGAKTSVLDGDETTVRKGNNGEIKIAKLDMDALGDFDRKSGYTKGSTSLTWETVKYDKERSQDLRIDRLDNDETLAQPFAKLSSEFLRTKVIPETDAARIAKICGTKDITVKEENIETGAELITALRACANKMDEDEVPMESRILFITPTLASLADDMDTTKSREVLKRFSQIISVPQSRMYTSITLHDGKANTVQAETVVAINNELENIRNNYLKSNIAEIKYATIESLKGVSGEFEQFKTNDFTAITGKVNDLTVGVEKVNTLMFGSATGESITTDFANSVVSMIGTAQIKDSMIDSLDAKKIKALDIDTTDVKVHSRDGKSQWTDNTIQISDSSRLRVQIGKDASGDYNMYVWDKKGNLMFDALGLTEQGVQREIIRNDMVKEDANISAGKLDIASLFNVINNDGTHTLKSNKIYLDDAAQTLNVLLQDIKTSSGKDYSEWGSLLKQSDDFITQKLWWTENIDGTSVKEKFSNVNQTLQEYSVSLSNMAKYDDEIYLISFVPTKDNYPAWDWCVPVYPSDTQFPREETWQYNDTEWDKYIGKVAYWENEGRAWRFVRNEDGSHGWKEIPNSETAYMLKQNSALRINLESISSSLSLTQQDLKGNYTKTEQLDNYIKQLITDDTTETSIVLSGEYATKGYADKIGSNAVSEAGKATSKVLANYSTTAEIISEINPGSTSISTAVTAKLGEYATTASLTAFIKNENGQLRSAIEAIADDITLNASGAINISGNKSVNINGNLFTLTSTNTTISADGSIDCKKLKAVNADLEGTFKNVNVTEEGITMTTTLIGGEYLMKSSTGAYLKIQGHFINLSNEDGTRNAVSIRRDGIYVDDYYYIRSGDAYYNLMDWIRHSETAGTVDISGNNCYIEGYYYIRHHGEWWKLEDYVKDIANN